MKPLLPYASHRCWANIEHKLGNVYHRLGAWELAESHFEAALNNLESRTSETQVDVQARLYADWSRTAHQRGHTRQAVELAQQSLTLATSANDTLALAQTHNMLGILANGQHDFEQARHHLQQSLELAEILADPAAQIAALNNLALTHSAHDDFEIALTLTEKALNLCATWGDRHREAALHNNLADLLHTVGQSEKAMAHLKQAVTIFAEIGAEAGGKQPEIWKLVKW
jgi:tetratricopeptide (TPR) repeat protein